MMINKYINKVLLSFNVKNVNTLFFIIYFILLIFYGKIRVVLFDGSLEIFTFIEDKKPHLAENRYPLLVCQFLPVLMSKLNCGVRIIINSYILNHTILPILVFINARYIVRNELFVTLIGISYCCINSLGFFVASHDSYNAFFYLLLFYPYFDIQYNPVKNLLLLRCLVFQGIFIICISHLSQFIALLFILAFLIANKRLTIPLYLILLFSFMATIFKFYVLMGSHEVSFIDDIGKSLMLSKIKLLGSFFLSLFTINISWLVLSLILIVVLLYKTKIGSLIHYIFFSLGFIAIISFVFGKFEGISWYTEPHYKFLALLGGIFLVDLLKDKALMASQCLIYLLFICSILVIGKDFKNYYNYIEKISKTITQNTIFIVNEKPKYEKKAFEFLLVESAVINLYEHQQCYFFQIIEKDTLEKDLFILPKSKQVKNFCFDKEYSFKDENISIKQLEDKYKWAVRF